MQPTSTDKDGTGDTTLTSHDNGSDTTEAPTTHSQRQLRLVTSSSNPFDRYNTPASNVMFPVGERKVGWQRRDGSYDDTANYKAIIRLNKEGNNAFLLAIVGANYKLIHNRELFTAIESAMISEMLPEHLDGVQVKDRVSGWGRICFREYVFPNLRTRMKNTTGDIAFRIVTQNGYGGSALRIHAGAIDFYCTNGMIRGEYVSTYKRHTSGVVVGSFEKTIRNALLEYGKATDEWQQWSETPVKHDKAIDFFKEIATNEKMRAGLVDQFLHERETRGNNLWAVYSTLTYYASHPEGAFALRKSVTEQDNEAITVLRHEVEVSQWMQSNAWRTLVDA